MARNEEDARTGWKARRDKGRKRGRRIDTDQRAEIRAARATLTTEETGFNQTVQPAGDYIAQMSDADLWAHYQSLTGQKPNGRARRDTVEAACRRIEAERAAVQRQSDDDAVEDDV